MAKARKFVRTGPACPRCGQTSKVCLNNKGRESAYCENDACVTKAFPPNSKRVHSDRVSMGDGPPCPRCQAITTAWEHSENWKPTPGKGYYTFWYQCMNDACTTNQVMPPEAYVASVWSDRLASLKKHTHPSR